MFDWYSHRSSTPPFLEAIPIISVIRATISMSLSFASTKTASPPTWTTICSGPRAGVKEGDLIFVSGHPGSTDRLKTVSQLEFLRDVSYPTRIAMLSRRIALVQSFGAISAENCPHCPGRIIRISKQLQGGHGFRARVERRGFDGREGCRRKEIARSGGIESQAAYGNWRPLERDRPGHGRGKAELPALRLC
jgi:hypothetical protein